MVSCFLKIPFLRIALTVVYVALVVVGCVALSAKLFSSPVLKIINISGTHLYGFAGSISFTVGGYQLTPVAVTSEPGTDIQISGANASALVGVYLWHVMLELNVTMPYETGFQVIKQKYNYEDIPCKEFTSVFKTMQILALLMVFCGFIQLVLIISNFFSRVLLPLAWVMGWVSVGMASGAAGLLLKRLTTASCYGTPEGLPDFAHFAFPVGGFGLFAICMLGYLVCAVMTAFL